MQNIGAQGMNKVLSLNLSPPYLTLERNIHNTYVIQHGKYSKKWHIRTVTLDHNKNKNLKMIEDQE